MIRLNVLVYAGPEVLQASLTSTLTDLRFFLGPHYAIQKVSPKSLGSHPWTDTCALLVLPGGSNLSLTSAVSAVSTYVEGGGAFLAFGTGAKSTPRTVRLGQGVQLSGSPGSSIDQVLRFFDKGTGSYIHPTFHSAGSSRSVVIRLSSSEKLENIHDTGANFVGLEHSQNVKILARYVNGNDEGKVAAVKCVFGKGGAILLGPNFETPITLVSAPSLAAETVAITEQNRQKFVRSTLVDLGLHLPPIQERSISHLLPQFLVSYKRQPAAVFLILEALAAPSHASQLSVFEDTNDIFHFHPLQQGALILEEARAATNRASCDPPVREPKHIVACPNGQLPDIQQTPLFDLALYFDTLHDARKKEGCAWSDDSLGFGEAILYGEVVTSTQTMLDKNPRLLSLLPSPLLSLASHQLAGRGRGSNVWLSPPGSLLMSLFLRISLSNLPAQKLVFVQYLFALAVVEACRENAVLGKWGKCIRLKWPNDLYVVVDDGEKRKFGGILVNTSFNGGNVEMVIGCGLNISCCPPLTSLSQLLPPGTPTSSYPSPERTAATVMSKFESMWTIFLSHNGSFDPFMNLYLERWLHTDEVVTLTTVTPPLKVRILGITPNHGLLRTVPENAGWNVREKDYVDLQPDGNSFDIMAGMIKAKT